MTANLSLKRTARPAALSRRPLAAAQLGSLDVINAGLMMTLSDAAHAFSFIGGAVALPLLAIAGFILHYRLRLASTLTLAVGLAIAVVGEFLQLLSPFAIWAYQELQSGLVVGEFPPVWYLGSVIASAGLLVTCVGFAWFALTARKRAQQ